MVKAGKHHRPGFVDTDRVKGIKPRNELYEQQTHLRYPIIEPADGYKPWLSCYIPVPVGTCQAAAGLYRFIPDDFHLVPYHQFAFGTPPLSVLRYQRTRIPSSEGAQQCTPTDKLPSQPIHNMQRHSLPPSLDGWEISHPLISEKFTAPHLGSSFQIASEVPGVPDIGHHRQIADPELSPPGLSLGRPPYFDYEECGQLTRPGYHKMASDVDGSSARAVFATCESLDLEDKCSSDIKGDQQSTTWNVPGNALPTESSQTGQHTSFAEMTWRP